VIFIGNWAFNGCTGLTSVIIPNNVASIGMGVFAYCTSLTSVTISNNVTSIGVLAFVECVNLRTVNIPSSVTFIDESAFHDCIGLKSVTVALDNVNYVSDNGVLFNKNKTTIVKYPSSKRGTYYNIPMSVTSIGSMAFEHSTNLRSITIPNSVTSIGREAFYNCAGLTSITIPNSVTSIGICAFSSCNNLKEITNLSLTPLHIDSETLECLPDGICLYVHDNSVNAYRADSVWNKIECIKAITVRGKI